MSVLGTHHDPRATILQWLCYGSKRSRFINIFYSEYQISTLCIMLPSSESNDAFTGDGAFVQMLIC